MLVRPHLPVAFQLQGASIFRVYPAAGCPETMKFRCESALNLRLTSNFNNLNYEAL